MSPVSPVSHTVETVNTKSKNNTIWMAYRIPGVVQTYLAMWGMGAHGWGVVCKTPLPG